MDTRTSRRMFLRTLAGSSAVSMLLAACGGTPTAPSAAGGATANAGSEPTAVPTPTPIVVGEGDLELTMWVQDFGPMVNAFQTAAQGYAQQVGNLKVTVQSLPYDDLQAKVIPAVAAGNEADLIMGYTNWYVATDISKLFLPLDESFGGRAEIERTIFPSAMNALNTPEDKVFYLPYLTGLNGASLTLNAGHYAEQGIDYTKFTSFEEFYDAAKTVTVREGDTVKRAGLSIWETALTVLKTWIWQLGGEFYNRETGVWQLSSPQGEDALTRLQNIYQKDKLSSLDIANREYESFVQGTLSTHLQGAWTLGVVSTTNPDMKLDVVPTPKLADATSDVVYPDHTSVVTLSRRLSQDDKRREAAIGLAKTLVSPDALIAVTDAYSGSLMSKPLYEDSRIGQTKFGTVSKRISESVWSRARFPQDRVANPAPALTELKRALSGEISVKDALTNADAYLNEQEKQARERLGL